MTEDIKSDMGYVINEGVGQLCRLIDFINEDKGDNNE